MALAIIGCSDLLYCENGAACKLVEANRQIDQHEIQGRQSTSFDYGESSVVRSTSEMKSAR